MENGPNGKRGHHVLLAVILVQGHVIGHVTILLHKMAGNPVQVI